MTNKDLKLIFKFHVALTQPEVTEFYHLVKCKNLPYSIKDIKKKVIRVCRNIMLQINLLKSVNFFRGQTLTSNLLPPEY